MDPLEMQALLSRVVAANTSSADEVSGVREPLLEPGTYETFDDYMKRMESKGQVTGLRSLGYRR